MTARKAPSPTQQAMAERTMKARSLGPFVFLMLK